VARNPQTHCRRAGERERWSRSSPSLTRQAAGRERFLSYRFGRTASDNNTLNLRPSTHPQWQQAAVRRESERGGVGRAFCERENGVLLRAQAANTEFLEPDASSLHDGSIRKDKRGGTKGVQVLQRCPRNATRQISDSNLCTVTRTYIHTYMNI
jgi:hypothetical protein